MLSVTAKNPTEHLTTRELQLMEIDVFCGVKAHEG